MKLINDIISQFNESVGDTGPKFTGYWKAKDPAPPGKKMVGSESVEDVTSNPTDKITMDIPLFIRMMEYAREDAKDDMDLHNVSERAIELMQQHEHLSMDNYNDLVGDGEKISEIGDTHASKKKLSRVADRAWTRKMQAGPASFNPMHKIYDPEEIERNAEIERRAEKRLSKPVKEGKLTHKDSLESWIKRFKKKYPGKSDEQIKKMAAAARYRATQDKKIDEEKKGLYYYVNKRKKAGTSRPKGHPKAPSEQDWKNAAKTAKKESVEEAGQFSYGKPPRKGTVAYNAAMKRKEDEKKTKPIEPKDQKVGVAKVTKEDFQWNNPNLTPDQVDKMNKNIQKTIKNKPYDVDKSAKDPRTFQQRLPQGKNTAPMPEFDRNVPSSMPTTKVKPKQYVSASKDIEQTDEDWMDDLYSAGRNFADTATLGGYKYARAGADYAAKNALHKLGYRDKGTDYQKELDQEVEKLNKDWEENPGASLAGMGAALAIPVAGEYGAAVKGAQGAAGQALDTYGKAVKMYPLAKAALGFKDTKNPKMEDKVKGADGKACWDGYRYAGTKNGKDICKPIKKGK